jgi:hypothetical protein
MTMNPHVAQARQSAHDADGFAFQALVIVDCVNRGDFSYGEEEAREGDPNFNAYGEQNYPEDHDEPGY